MVLVVEDNLTICRTLERLLQNSGIDAKCVLTATEAVQILDRAKPKAIVLDNHMPDMSGIELLKIIRSRPDLQALPVVMFSADSSPDEMEEARRLGASKIFIKGQSDLDDLIETVRTLSTAN